MKPLLSCCHPYIAIRGSIVNRVRVTKFLGVLIDEHLNWREHIKMVYGKINKCLAILYKSSQVLFIDSLRLLYCALFLPHLDYCCEVWGSTYKSSLECISCCQRKAIRIVCRRGKREHARPLFTMLRLLRFCDLVELRICIFMFKGKSRLLPVNLQNRIVLLPANKRNNRTFCISYARTTKKLQSVFIKGPKLYNKLADIVRFSNTVSHVKSLLKKFFLDTYV